MTRERWQDSEKVKAARYALKKRIVDHLNNAGLCLEVDDGESPELDAICSAVAEAVSVPPEAAREPWRKRTKVQDALNAIIESAGHPQFEHALPEALHNLCDLVAASQGEAERHRSSYEPEKWILDLRQFAEDARARKTLNGDGTHYGIVRMSPDDVLALCDLAEGAALATPPAAPQETENAILQVIDERDRVQDDFDKAYSLVVGEQPEWSSAFTRTDALDRMDEALASLAKAAPQADTRDGEAK